jgi:hypothetical protein
MAFSIFLLSIITPYSIAFSSQLSAERVRVIFKSLRLKAESLSAFPESVQVTVFPGAYLGGINLENGLRGSTRL